MYDCEPKYKSYILRLWRTQTDPCRWRVRLEDVGDHGEPHYFADLDALIAFLKLQEGGVR